MAGPTPVHSSVGVSTSEVLIAAARPTRRGVMIYNHSTEPLYIKYGTGVAITPASFTLKIPADWYGRMPWGGVYAGAIYGVWGDVDADGSAQVTELVG